ncbi:MAG: hypothetical protein IPO32_12995 [Crocinitomicaceae bacterium]|nr:hypothetical protein [Crocinitomicaceae bacterium]
MQTRLNAFGVKAAKAAVDDEIKAEEGILKDKQKELSDLESDQAKKKKKLKIISLKLPKTKKAIEESKKNQETKKGEIKEQETKVQTVMQKKRLLNRTPSCF